MDNQWQVNISIPVDNDGYALLQCSHCGSYFKVQPKDLEDENILNLHCPSCGLISDNYLTEDAMSLAQNMFKNEAMNIIYDQLKTIEKQFKGSSISFKAGKKPLANSERPLQSSIDDLVSVVFSCCARKAKIKPILKMTGGYCLFCGVKNYELE